MLLCIVFTVSVSRSVPRNRFGYRKIGVRILLTQLLNSEELMSERASEPENVFVDESPKLIRYIAGVPDKSKVTATCET